jgi:MarR family transcriptional regulator, negative regulator of the multidrug operon emrRAB
MNSKKRLSQSETEAIVTRAHQRAAGGPLGDVKIGILIRQSHSLLMDTLNRYLAPFGLSTGSYFAMNMLYGKAENLANPSELCLITGETRANMTRICDELVEKNLMHRVTNLEDRRRVDLSLTDAGVALLKRVVPALREKNQTMLSVFDEEEKAMLVTLLSRLNQRLEG